MINLTPLELIGIILGTLIVGALVGFFTAAACVAASRADAAIEHIVRSNDFSRSQGDPTP